MTTEIISGAAARPDRLDPIEALLKRYPRIDEAELAELKRWFAKEASAFEVASLASKDHLRDQYSAFRAEHVDRWRPRDLVVAIAGAAVVVIAILLMAL